jgi:hypothetical protein
MPLKNSPKEIWGNCVEFVTQIISFPQAQYFKHFFGITFEIRFYTKIDVWNKYQRIQIISS